MLVFQVGFMRFEGVFSLGFGGDFGFRGLFLIRVFYMGLEQGFRVGMGFELGLRFMGLGGFSFMLGFG